jgi:hypothetical protein
MSVKTEHFLKNVKKNKQDKQSNQAAVGSLECLFSGRRSGQKINGNKQGQGQNTGNDIALQICPRPHRKPRRPVNAQRP